MVYDVCLNFKLLLVTLKNNNSLGIPNIDFFIGQYLGK